MMNVLKVSVRLVGGGVPTQGRVEISVEGQWGSICSYGWQKQDADVVCRMLGLPPAAAALSRAEFGQGRGVMWLSEVTCTGKETSIGDCEHLGWGVASYCSPSSVAGVICGTPSGNCT